MVSKEIPDIAARFRDDGKKENVAPAKAGVS